MWLFSLVACGGPPGDMVALGLPEGLTRGPVPGGETAEPDTQGETGDTGPDTASDTGGETGAETGSDTGGETGWPAEVCWLGLDRDDSVCVPTVADDGSFGSDYAYPPAYKGSAQYAMPERFVDLDAIDPDLDIAPNFVVSEYMVASKGRWGILQPHHVEKLQEIRDAIGGPLTITSGYRNPTYNAGVGGATYSRHMYGDGADLDASGWSVEELGLVCEDLGADYVGLYEDGHTHCDWRDEPLDPAYWTPTFAAPPPAPVATARFVIAGGMWSAPAEGFDEGEPLRRWWAWGEDGVLLTTTTGRTFAPPAGTARVSVLIGGSVRLDGEPG